MDDPGWPIGGWWLVSLLPGVRLFLRHRLTAGTNGLVALRQAFLSYCFGVIAFGVALVFLWPSQSAQPKSPGVAIGLLVLGAALAIVGRVIEKPLDCTGDRQLAGTYRVRFFVRIACSEAAALFGFVGFFMTSEWWVYPGGAAIAFVGFVRAAPTRARLLRDQELLAEGGCHRSLVAALVGLRA